MTRRMQMKCPAAGHALSLLLKGGTGNAGHDQRHVAFPVSEVADKSTQIAALQN